MKFPRSFYIPKGAVKVADKQSDAVAYVYTGRNGKPAALVFSGKADKPAWQFWFRTAAAREQRVREFFDNVRAHKARAEQNRAERKAFRHNVQVGDIYRTCWGYDQTNVEFFEVVEVRGKYAILRELQMVTRDNGQGSENCVPQSGKYREPRYQGDERGQPLRRLIQQSGTHGTRIKIDEVRDAWPWGERVAGAVIGRPVSQTAFGWGH